MDSIAIFVYIVVFILCVALLFVLPPVSPTVGLLFLIYLNTKDKK